MIIRITVWTGKPTEVEPTHMTYKGSWTFEGPQPNLTPRLIWLMNTIQELIKEFKRRSYESDKVKGE